jgi:RepB DNA-primase from phage plasmid
MHWQTLDSITKQIRAMGCAEYELGVLDPKDGKINEKKGTPDGRMHLRPRPPKSTTQIQPVSAGADAVEANATTSALPKPPMQLPQAEQGLVDAEIMTKYVPWLGRMNSNGGVAGNGCHIFIRPFGPTNLTFIDDLKLATVEQMKKDGFQFAVLIESSPNNFHGWLKHNQVLEPLEETTAAQMLCERYGGDPGAASKRRFGRLAGFTNRKDAYHDPGLNKNGAGGYPFVKLREATGLPFDKTDDFMREVRDKIQANQIESGQKSEKSRQYETHYKKNEDRIKDISYFQRKLSAKGERYAADFQYALHALQNGKSVSEVEHVIKTQSNSSANKGNYAQRTIESVHKILSPRTGSQMSHQSELGR